MVQTEVISAAAFRARAARARRRISQEMRIIYFIVFLGGAAFLFLPYLDKSIYVEVSDRIDAATKQVAAASRLASDVLSGVLDTGDPVGSGVRVSYLDALKDYNQDLSHLIRAANAATEGAPAPNQAGECNPPIPLCTLATRIRVLESTANRLRAAAEFDERSARLLGADKTLPSAWTEYATATRRLDILAERVREASAQLGAASKEYEIATKPLEDAIAKFIKSENLIIQSEQTRATVFMVSRVALVLLVVFLVQFLMSRVRALSRLAYIYESRADAIELMQSQSNGLRALASELVHDKSVSDLFVPRSPGEFISRSWFSRDSAK